MPNAGQIIRASDVPRVVAFALITANSSDIGTTETVVATLGSASYQTGRAYRVRLSCLVAGSTANNEARLKVKKGSTVAGTNVMDTWGIRCFITTSNYRVFLDNYFTPDSNFTDSFCLTLDLDSGAGTVRVAAGATENQGTVIIEDLGADSLNSYPGINGIS
jgi:hypothetical protein